MALRSKNHMLYEMFLEEMGFKDVYENTKTFSLGHIVKFVEHHPAIAENESSSELLEILTGESKSISVFTDSDFSIISSIKAMKDTVSPGDVYVIQEVIEKIDLYHEAKRK